MHAFNHVCDIILDALSLAGKPAGLSDNTSEEAIRHLDKSHKALASLFRELESTDDDVHLVGPWLQSECQTSRGSDEPRQKSRSPPTSYQEAPQDRQKPLVRMPPDTGKNSFMNDMKDVLVAQESMLLPALASAL